MKNFIYLLAILIIAGCKNSSKDEDTIAIHLSSNPDKIQPYASVSADAFMLEKYTHQKLIDWDYEKGDFVGVLAMDRPTITETSDGLKLEFEIRPEATWDDGSPITGYDVVFSFKAMLNPKTTCEQIRPYYDFIKDVEVDEENPKKLTVYSNQKYILVEEYAGYWVLPEYIYDKEKIMRKFTIPQLMKDKDELKGNSDILKFADEFNSSKYAREKGFVVGSGPYEFVNWTTGREIKLKLKDNWWGRNSIDMKLSKYGNVKNLKFKVINDWSTTTTALKGGDLDCVRSIEYKNFVELQEDKGFTDKYFSHTPTTNIYYYIGLNCSHPILKDINVRKALAHAVNKQQLIETLLYGLANPVESMVNPSKSYYNHDLKPFAFDIEKASEILDKAGWKDTDGDGLRDKVLNGKKTQMELDFKYNSGNETRKNIGLMFKENLKKLGIKLNIVTKEWTVFLDDTKNHDFDIYTGAWVGDPNVGDPKQIWHTESSNGGSNYVNYGDNVSDKMIDDIRKELNVEKRRQIYLKFQEKVHNEVPYIFLYTPLERLAFSKRFKNANPYPVRPGFDLGLWENNQKEVQ